MRMRKRLLILGNGLVAGSMDCWDSRLPFFWGRNGPPGMETKPEPRRSKEIQYSGLFVKKACSLSVYESNLQIPKLTR